MMLRHMAGAALAAALAGFSPSATAATPTRVILVGDSTMATHNGYGDALCAHVTPDVTCLNLAKNGRSSRTFREEGRWAEVQQLLKDGAGYGATYVLIQFGHNDQPGKPGRSTDLVTEFPANMQRYADEVRALGGTPVLVTPLTRRTFRGAWLNNDLAPWAEATRQAAARTHAALLDLNADSVAAVQPMGQDEADTLAMVPRPANYGAPAADLNKVEPAGATKSDFDRTHLGARGAALFARIVETEMVRALPDTRAYFRDGGRP
jgi:lysophospholipase L1-like esterase